jgi:uncharacterized protein (TIRG00374 family)
MSRRQVILSIVGFALLAALMVHQFRTSPEWRRFNWRSFREATEDANGLFILGAVALIYVGYFLRTLRWRVLMQPAGDFWQVLKGTIIGFTGVALFGRPGEVVRPYYIARKHRTGISPQFAIWILERVFDCAAIVLLVGLDLLLSRGVLQAAKEDESFGLLRRAGIMLTLVVLVLIAALVLFRRWSDKITDYVASRATNPNSFKAKLAYFLDSLAQGIQPVTRVKTLLLCSAYTVSMWVGVGVAVWLVIRGYPDMADFSYAQALLVLGFTLVGSIVQLPVVGGGVQVLTIFGLTEIFDVDAAPAASAALLIWLISFYAITPFGAALAAREGISWRKLEQEALESEAAEEQAEVLSHHPRPSST